MVAAAEEFEIAVGEQASAVAGAVDARSPVCGICGKGIGTETFRSVSLGLLSGIKKENGRIKKAMLDK